jgi:Fe-S oxidoreductase
VRTMGEDWNQIRPGEPADEDLPLDATVEHHSEFLARHADLLRTTESGQNVTFHDPCYLGRYRNVYEDPRLVIARTSTLIEPARTRDRSFCCGAGGGLAFLGEQGGRGMNIERANELVATGADVVATACPFCTAMFQDAQPQAPATGAPLFLDIAQIVAQQLAD